VGGTIAILMGVANRAEIAAELQAGGLAGDTPVAAVHAATTLRQEVVRCRLDELGCAAVRSPAVIVVGAVAALDIIGADAVGVTPGRSGHSAN
ncbi:MAG: uroporphyrinogen-III C-methyltransferase, partial [Candidatus Microthrix parvicella]|nr:uroporphyrinogen-III C-methyltransferase [Candidatus Microthrix parvicella]